MISLLTGFIFIALGIMGLRRWPQEFVHVLEGLLPVSILFGGIIGVVMGISTLGHRPSSSPAAKKDHEKK